MILKGVFTHVYKPFPKSQQDWNKLIKTRTSTPSNNKPLHICASILSRPIRPSEKKPYLVPIYFGLQIKTKRFKIEFLNPFFSVLYWFFFVRVAIKGCCHSDHPEAMGNGGGSCFHVPQEKGGEAKVRMELCSLRKMEGHSPISFFNLFILNLVQSFWRTSSK